MSKNIVIALLAVLVIGALVWLSRDSAIRQTNGEVRIAANLPLSGPLAVYGVAVREGATMALDRKDEPEPQTEANFHVDWQDNRSDPKTAVSILRKQLLNDPQIYISGVKPQTMAIKDELSEIGIPHFVWIFDAIINERTENNLRTWVNYKLEPSIYKRYAADRGARRIAVTYVQLPHTIDEFERLVIPAFKSDGIEVMAEPYEFGLNNSRDIAAKIVNFQPDLIILNGFQADLVSLVRSLRPLDAIKDGNTIATFDLLDAAKILGADELEGLRVVAPVFETRANDPAIAAWRKSFIDRYGKEPLYTHAFAYDMMRAIMAASAEQRSSHRLWLEALRNVNAQGVTGPIKFDEDGDMITTLEVGVYKGGTLVTDEAQAGVTE